MKRGELRYYLTPAALWNGFEDLTINLTLGEDMPVLMGSSLEFEKVGERSYRYHSAALPGEDLWITVDENWYQNFFSILRSPYLMITLTMMAPFLLIAAAVVAVSYTHLDVYKRQGRHWGAPADLPSTGHCRRHYRADR